MNMIDYCPVLPNSYFSHFIQYCSISSNDLPVVSGTNFQIINM